MSTNDYLLKKGKVKLGMKMGYGIGQMADSIAFNVFYFFFLFFLTDVAGLSPAIAGSVSLIAVLWDGISDPVIGYLSDNSKNPKGRRRPMMLAAAIPFGISMYLLFLNVDLSTGMKNAYYIAVAILFWTFYTMYVIPYFALGAEITQDFDERTSLRTVASVFMQLAVMVASAAPPMIVAMTMEKGGTFDGGWRNVGLIFGILTIAIVLITWKFTKGGEIDLSNTDREKENIFKTYKEILKLKPSKYLAAAVMFFSCTVAMASGSLIYLMIYKLNFAEALQSTFFIALTLIAIAWLPIINFAAIKFGKRPTYILTVFITAISLIAFTFIGFTGFSSMIVYAVLFSVGNSTFWTVYYSMMYDISELDEFINNKRREGAITSVVAFFQKVGAAVGMWLTGVILQASGYIGGAETQSESAINGIVKVITLYPGILAAISGLLIIAYPLTAKRFRKLETALELKKEGKKYSAEGFEELVS